MPPLAELQRQFAQAVMGGNVPAGLFVGAVPPQDALGVHRGTIIAALVNALRLSYPTVLALVGDDFFDQTARIFAEDNLPARACLNDYGDGFAAFLSTFEPAASLSYLPDVARLDRAVETRLHAPARTHRFALDDTTALDLPESLILLRLAYPAHAIRAALGDDTALAAIDMAPAEQVVMVWRKENDAAVTGIHPAAGRFLAALLAGDGADKAFAAALTGTPQDQALHVLQSEIFAASFCTVISNKDNCP
jgi:hypothetical protein